MPALQGLGHGVDLIVVGAPCAVLGGIGKRKSLAGTTRLELATSDVTGRRSNQLSYVPAFGVTSVSY